MPKTYINFSVQILNWKHIFHFQFRFWTESHNFSSDSELKTKNTFSVQILNWKPHFSVQILNWKPKIYFQFRCWTESHSISSDSKLKFKITFHFKFWTETFNIQFSKKSIHHENQNLYQGPDQSISKWKPWRGTKWNLVLFEFDVISKYIVSSYWLQVFLPWMLSATQDGSPVDANKNDCKKCCMLSSRW